MMMCSTNYIAKAGKYLIGKGTNGGEIVQYQGESQGQFVYATSDATRL